MQLSKIAVEEYREIFYKQYGEDISEDEAKRQGVVLLTLLDKITKGV